jgi:tRNA-splicing ligase RtcB
MPEHLSDHVISWASILEDQAREQALTSGTMPFIYPHLALMPDAHYGLGATVGSVIPTEGAIIPAAVGVDIGCGCLAVRTEFTAEDLEQARMGVGDHPRPLSMLHTDIVRRVPMSAGGYNQRCSETSVARNKELAELPGAGQAYGVARNWELQLGSLGSGNHFIEVSLDEQDRVWLFLHSGSRGVGNKLAQKWIKVAQEKCRQWHIQLPDPNLAYLPEDTPEFDGYLEALTWAQRFAYLNRAEMMDRVIAAFEEYIGDVVDPLQVIDTHHNYTVRERHFNREVWLTRKGAISAKKGEWGLIPGSMGDKSYVVQGLGNPVALESSPHGAGRMYSRGAARKLFTLDDLDKRMQGVAWGNSAAFLDEHPDAYKPVDAIMLDAADLVEVRHTLRQTVNCKGQ